MKKAQTDNQKTVKNRLLSIAVFNISGIFLIVFAALAGAVLGNYFYYETKFLPNTYIGTTDVSGKTVSQASIILANQLEAYLATPLEIQVNDYSFTSFSKELGVTLDYRDEIAAVFQSQHDSDNVDSAITTYLSAHFQKKQNVPLSAHFDGDKFNETVYAKCTSLTPAAEPKIVFRDGNFVVEPGSAGYWIEESERNKLAEKISYLDGSRSYLVAQKREPTLSNEDAKTAADAANELAKKSLVLKAGNVQIKVDFKSKPELLKFQTQQEQTEASLFTKPISNYYYEGGVVAGESTGPVITIELSEESLDKLVNEEIIAKLNSTPENITLTLNELGKIQVQGKLKDGYALDKEKAVTYITENFNKGIYEYDVPIVSKPGQIIDNTGMNLGIKELLAVGESDFAGSDSNRINNVQVGLSRFQNIIIAPGEVFNYADYIGPIDAAHGFLPGWVIKSGNRLEREYGGGICQTSTTLFRAAFYAGLPILERHNHGYDVEYYRWPQIGLDASVYVPYSSMQFKNDTANYILIQQEVNVQTHRAYVWLYGTKDGRTVDVTGPNVYGRYYSQNVIEVPTTTIPTGTRKLSHGAVGGVQTDWFRTVTYADGKQMKYTVHSNYTAVPATYLVGQ